MFGEKSRSLVHDLMEFGILTIEDGKIRFLTTRERTPTWELLAKKVHLLIELDEAIRIKLNGVSTRLAANALADSVLPVQLANFEELAASYPKSKKTHEVAVTFLKSSEPPLQLTAARYLASGEAIAVLRSLAIRPGVDEELRESALIALTSKAGRSDALPALDHLLRYSITPRRLRLAAIREAGRIGLEEILPLLLRRVREGG